MFFDDRFFVKKEILSCRVNSISPENLRRLSLLIIASLALFGGGCGGIFKTKIERPVLLKTENADLARLLGEVNRLARVRALRAKMDLKFEDNSFAEVGLAEAYRAADCEIIVQRPANILVKVKAPFIGADIAQMSSDGEKFRVAILKDNAGGRLRKFVSGTNNADYAPLQNEMKKTNFAAGAKDAMPNVSAFANLRPQHFTDALLVRPADPQNFQYARSVILLEEDAAKAEKSQPRKVLRGYYLLDEFQKSEDGNLILMRRFWFDRTTAQIRLARQQIFDSSGEIESDIGYKSWGDLTETGDYREMPLRIEITRPKEKYKISLAYQSPAEASIGKTYAARVFTLENSWGLEEINLDRKLSEVKGGKATAVQAN